MRCSFLRRSLRAKEEKVNFIRLTPLAKRNGLKAGLVSLAPREEIGWHSTKEHEEAIIILAGKAKINIAQKSFTASAETFIYIGQNKLHNVKNISYREPLRYVYITNPK